MSDINLTMDSSQPEHKIKKLEAMFDKLALSVERTQTKMAKIVLARPETAARYGAQQARAFRKGYERTFIQDHEAFENRLYKDFAQKAAMAGRREGSLSARMAAVSQKLKTTPYGSQEWKRLRWEAGQLDKEFKQLHTRAGVLRNSMSQLAKWVGNVTIFIAAALFVITALVSIFQLAGRAVSGFVKAGADVSDMLDEMAVSFGMTAAQSKEFAAISEKTREQTGSSQKDVNKAFKELMNVGLSADQALGKLDHTLKLSRNSSLKLGDAALVAATNIFGLDNQLSKLNEKTDQTAMTAWKKFTEQFKSFAAVFYKEASPSIANFLQSLGETIKTYGPDIIQFGKDYIDGWKQIFDWVSKFRKNQFKWDDKKGAPAGETPQEKLSNQAKTLKEEVDKAFSTASSLSSLTIKPTLEEGIKISQELYKKLGIINDDWRSLELAKLSTHYSKVAQIESSSAAERLKIYDKLTRDLADMAPELKAQRALYRDTGYMSRRQQLLETQRAVKQARRDYGEWLTPDQIQGIVKDMLEDQLFKQRRKERRPHEDILRTTGAMTGYGRLLRESEANMAQRTALKYGATWQEASLLKTIKLRQIDLDAMESQLEGQEEYYEKTGKLTEKYNLAQLKNISLVAENAKDIFGFTLEEAAEYSKRLTEELHIKMLENSMSTVDALEATFLRLQHQSEPISKKMADVWEDTAKDMNQNMQTFFFDMMENRFISLENIATSVLKSIQRGINEMLYQYMMFGASGKGGLASVMGMGLKAAIGGMSGMGYFGDQSAAAAVSGWAGTPFQHGGTIYEHIIGRGQKSGKMYQFGERGPEDIVPQGGGGNGETHITIYAIDSKSFAEICNRNPQVILGAANKALRGNPATRRSFNRLLG